MNFFLNTCYINENINKTVYKVSNLVIESIVSENSCWDLMFI